MQPTLIRSRTVPTPAHLREEIDGHFRLAWYEEDANYEGGCRLEYWSGSEYIEDVCETVETIEEAAAFLATLTAEEMA